MRSARQRSKLLQKLKHSLAGDLLSDNEALEKCSRDQSIYEIMPLAVVFPASMEDLQKVIAFASDEGIPMTPRGGGSGTAGSALGGGLIIALNRGGFLGQIDSFTQDQHGPIVTAGAGVYHDHLQKFLRALGFYLPADPSSGMISQIGGNIATKASGPHALKHGSIDRFVHRLEFLTDRGEWVDTGDEKTIPSRIKTGIENLTLRIRKDKEAGALLDARRGMKTASGYNMFGLVHDLPVGERAAQLIVGSVGTLGFITCAALRGEPYDPEKAAMLLHFDDLAEAGRAVCAIRDLGAAAIELMNKETVRVIRRRSANRKDFPVEAHTLLVEFEGGDRLDLMDRVRELLGSGRYLLAGDPTLATTDHEIEQLWKVRKEILPVISHLEPHLRALSVVNDVGVPPNHLAEFISDLRVLFERHETETMIYGHAGNGNLHLRPLFDVTKPGLKKRIQALADEVYETVFKYGGTIAAEHGMGRLRAPYLEQEWGEALFGYMKEVKSIFDPAGIFNPEAMFSSGSIVDHMRQELLSRERGEAT